MKEFNRETLAAFNGGEERPAYIAFEGKVFDVSRSVLWKKGLHMKRHAAGSDLTAEFPAAPHGEEVFTKYPQVGILVPRAGRERPLTSYVALLVERYPMLQRHPHPMAVHFPIVFFIAAALFDLLAALTGSGSFETTALHCLVAGILSLPFAALTGFLTWWLNYMAKPMKSVIWKIILSCILLAVSGCALVWRFEEPRVLDPRNASGIVYMLLVFSFVPVVSLIGWLGGNLTFPYKSRSQ